MSSQHQSASPNLVGGHYRVGRKIGEGSFGVIFEGPFSLLCPPHPFLQLEPVFFDRDEPPQFTDRRYQIRQSKSASVLARAAIQRSDTTSITGTSQGRGPPAERRMSLVSYPRRLPSVQYALPLVSTYN
jgi:hypothetical protein